VELALQRDVPDERIKRAIASLPDVQACNVEFNSDGTISAIHIVTSTRRSPKQIVRDVESVLLADFDTKIDHRKVSVARVEDKGDARHERPQRAKLVAIASTVSAGKGSVEVTLERAGLTVTGQAAGVADGGGGIRLVAHATLRALEKMVGQDASFELLDVVRIRSGERRAVVVLANFVSSSAVRGLAGCVQFDDDEARAAALAALDASNRMIELASQPEQTEYEVTPFTEH
jgi:hypothetical protein